MAGSQNLTGLFIGAGASYEAGMPLTHELTSELTKWLTPKKLRQLNQSWRSQGGGYPDDIIDDFASVLTRSDQHYESLLGYLEVQFKRCSNSISQQYHGLYSWLVEMVYYILYLSHINNADYIQRNLNYYDGLSVLVEQNNPLWIFSLNHDIIIECIASRIGIPLSSGFTDEVVALPLRNQQGTVIGHLKGEVLPGDHLESSAMPFFQHGTPGINLLKIHGALDIFTFRDGKDLLKILPLGDGAEGMLNALRATNEELLYEPQMPLKATNEIVYADQAGEMQFLRRSLLAGAFKFDSRHTQVLPVRLLEHFRSYINYIQKLICIGYGFRDDHINKIMREWLEFSNKRHLVIVDPKVKSVPSTLLHVAPQVELYSANTTDYLDSCASIHRCRREAIEKKLTAWIRGNRETAIAELRTFSREHNVKKLVEWIKQLPLRDGDIDIDSLPVSFDELTKEALQLISTPEEIFAEFLESKNL